MTVQEAIEKLKYIKYIGNGEQEYKKCSESIAIDMAIEALEKQEAKKPRIKKALGIITMECPCCKKKESYIGSGVLSKHCPECGQKLDWSD